MIENPEKHYTRSPEIARDMADAEKPGRDYLLAHPNLKPEQVRTITYHMGVAAGRREIIHEGFGLGLDHYDFKSKYDSYPTIPKSWLDRNTLGPLHLEDSPLVEEWSHIPGMRLLNGRPVINEQDMRAYANEAREKGAVHRKEMGARVWGALRDSIWRKDAYAPTEKKYAGNHVFSRLQYFTKHEAEEAGLPADDYLDLYSLYKLRDDLSLLRPVEMKASAIHIGSSTIEFIGNFIQEVTRQDSEQNGKVADI